MKNKNISWQEYFMGVAKLSSLRSKDPSTKVGAVIVNAKKRIVGVGYNGMPNGNDDLPWNRDGDLGETKYPYVIHAEINAVLNSNKELSGSTIYTTLYPCSNCAKFLVQAGVKKLIYLDDKYNGTDDDIASKKLFEIMKIETIQIDDFKLNI